MIVQIIAQILNNQSFLIIHLSANSVAVFITFKFEKLFDIFEYENNKNNHNARITNFEKEHYKQDRVNLKDD